MAEVSEKDLLPGEVSEADLEPEGGAEGGGGGDKTPSKPLLRSARTVRLDAPEDPLDKAARETHDKQELVNELSHGQWLQDFERHDPERADAFRIKSNERALGDGISIARGVPFVGSHIDELSALLQTGKTGGPDYDKKVSQARNAVGDAVSSNPSGPLIGALAFAPFSPSTSLGRVGFNAAAAASEGAGSAPNMSEAPSRALKDAIAAGLLSTAVEAPYAATQKLGNSSKEMSRGLALRPFAKPDSKAMTDLVGSGRSEEIADRLLGHTRPFSSAEETAGRVGGSLRKTGADLGALRGKLDAASGGASVMPDTLADDLASAAHKYGGSTSPESAATPEAAAVMQDLLARAKRAREFGGGKPLSLAEAEARFKTPLNEAARKSKVATDPSTALLARELARDTAAKSNETAAEAVAAAMAPNLSGKYGPLKREYGDLEKLAPLVARKNPAAFKGAGIESTDLPDLEFAAGGGPGGASGGIMSRLWDWLPKDRAMSAAAKGLEKAGPLAKIPAVGRATSGLTPYLELLEEDDNGRR